jgi:hypothetical protein
MYICIYMYRGREAEEEDDGRKGDEKEEGGREGGGGERELETMQVGIKFTISLI